MSGWAYADFPAVPDATPISGDGDEIFALQANELREAVIRRANLIGTAVAVPDEVADLEICYISWLTGMRAAIEELLYEAQYGNFDWHYVDPNWSHITWSPWTKATVLARVHDQFIDNALVTDPEDWMQAADSSAALDGHPELKGNPVFHESGDLDEQVSGYEHITGFRKSNLDADLKLYVSLIDEGGGQFHVELYKDASRSSGSRIAHTGSFNTPGPQALAWDHYSGISGYITVDQLLGQDTDIEVRIEHDKSIMYAAHINELYYVLEFLCYLEVAASFTATPVSGDGSWGMGDGPGPEWDWASMMEAYDEGWTDFEAHGYTVGGGSLYAEATSHLYWDEWGGQHYYYVGDSRVREVQAEIPTTPYPIIELALPFWAMAADSTMNHWADMFECWMGTDFSGNGVWMQFGDLSEEWGGSYFFGWLAWFGEWNGDTLSFTYRWPGIEIGLWGGPHIHDDYLSVYLDKWSPIFGGFVFAETGDNGYRNGEWSPIGSGEWGVFHHF